MFITTEDLSDFLNLFTDEEDAAQLETLIQAAEEYVRGFLIEPYKSCVAKVETDAEGATTITFETAGNDPQPVTMPEPIRHAVRLVASHLYEAREVVAIGPAIRQMPLGVAELIMPYRGFAF